MGYINMYASHRSVGENEFVETLGLEFDELQPGTIVEHRPGFSFTWAESRYRSALAGDHAPAVLDMAASSLMGGGQPQISATWIVSTVVAATTRAFGRVVANLEWSNVSFANPVRDGDTVYAESEIIAKRLSQSRPGQGVLTIMTRATRRDDGAEVCRYQRSLLVYRSAEGPHHQAGYV